MFETVLVANRGESARRVVRTCHRLGLKAVTVHSEADAGARHVVESDESVLLGPAPPAQSYLDVARVVEAARQTGAQAVHPGYGLLAEDATAARAVRDAGLAWVGPPPEVLEAVGDRAATRRLAQELGIAVAPAVDGELPAVVKAGRAGRGPRAVVAHDAATRDAAVAERGPALVERFLRPARHVEVQLLGLVGGAVVHLGERDCSVQRDLQKVVAESPAPRLDAAVRGRLVDGAVRLAEAAGLLGAGTVEFLVLPTGEEVFLELTPRLQVEHPVTELVHDLDLVELQLRIAAGERLDLVGGTGRGCAVELRVYAEDPTTFRPTRGRITGWHEPPGVRVDSGVGEGDEVVPWYDPLLAKVAVWAPTREAALEQARAAVAGFVVEGPRTNLPFLAALLRDEAFLSGQHDTGLVEGKSA